MARAPNEKLDKAKELFDKGYKLIDIAKELDIPDGTVRRWKKTYSWGGERSETNKKNNERSDSKKRKSTNKSNSEDENKIIKGKTNLQNPKARYGNQNAKGNKGGKGGPFKNKHAETHGFFSKYLPDETFELIEEIQNKDPLDIIWENITIQYAAIIRSQKLMHVSDNREMIKEIKKIKGVPVKGEDDDIEILTTETEYEFQFAWDRQATFLNAQSRAMSTLQSMIRNYIELLNKNWDLATEEQKQRVEKLQAEINKLTGNNLEIEDTEETDRDIYGD